MAHRSFVTVGFLVVAASVLGAPAFAGTSPRDAKVLDEARANGLSAALVAHVEQTEARACQAADQALQEVTVTRLAAGGTVDYVEGAVDAKGKAIPRTYWEDYTAYYLVVHACYSGSTKSGSWVEPARSTIWRVSYRQQRDVGAKQPRWFPRSPLKLERVQDLPLPALDLAGS
jgi:hypothetical protein